MGLMYPQEKAGDTDGKREYNLKEYYDLEKSSN